MADLTKQPPSPQSQFNAAALAGNTTVGPHSGPGASSAPRAHAGMKHLTQVLAYRLPTALARAQRSRSRLAGLIR